MLLSLIAMAQAVRIWDWRPGTPLSMTGDGPWMAALIRGYIDYGPYSSVPLFGAPYALNTGWSSTGNDIHVWALTALGVLTSDPYTVWALYFFIGFPLSALTMYWLCRKYGVARSAAVMAGVLFSVVPGHQERAPHLFLASYWAVPFIGWLIIETAAGRPVLRRPVDRTLSEVWRALVAPLLMLMAIGLGDVYYVAFTLVIVVPIIVVRQVRRPNLRQLGALLVPLAVMLVPVVVSLAAARHRADEDTLVGSLPWGRSFVDSAAWSGQIIDLLMPWPGHRIPNLAIRSQAYDAVTGTTGEVSAIGFVAVIGLVCLFAASGWSLLRRGADGLNPLLAALAVAAVIAVAFFTRGGLGAVTAFYLTPQIRTWSRLFLFIAMFGLLAVAWFVTRLASIPGGRRRTVIATSVVLLVLGVLDQTNPGRAPEYQANQARLTELSAFDNAVESRLGTGCSVFVVPVVGFPEVNDPLAPELMTLGVASRGLRWSFGGIHGTAQADWQLGLSTTDAQDLVDDVASVGFCGVVMSSATAARLPALAEGIRTMLGAPIARTSDGTYEAYDVRPARQALLENGAASVEARAEATLHPVVVSLRGTWARPEAAGVRYPLGPAPSFSIANMSSTSRKITIHAQLLGPAQGRAAFTFTGPGLAGTNVSVGSREAKSVDLIVTAPAGGSEVSVAGGDVADWTVFEDEAGLPSLTSLTATSSDPAVNVGVDLPLP